MICSEFTIFALSITPFRFCRFICNGCDLLRIYYFCTINHTTRSPWTCLRAVVICSEFTIFALSITPLESIDRDNRRLWFAPNLLFLHYQSHLSSFCYGASSCCDLLRIYYFCTINHTPFRKHRTLNLVVICSEFTIFALSITPRRFYIRITISCDLLRIYYFCTINHTLTHLMTP